jgi:DNA-binding PadR family transcriptional regulator
VTPAQPDIEGALPLTPLSFHVLLALADGEKHGYAILKDIESRTDGQMRTASGALYLAAERLRETGMIEESDSRPDPALDDRRRKYYRLTGFGRQVACGEAERLVRLARMAVDAGLAEERSAKPWEDS